MKYLEKGRFYGKNNQTINSESLIFTDYVYSHDTVDWHYHENAYFTYILKGHLFEGNKKESYDCTPGTILFHHRQEPHYNITYPGFTQGFHIELENDWFDRHFLNNSFPCNTFLDNPNLKSLFSRLYCEMRISDNATRVSMEGLLLQVF